MNIFTQIRLSDLQYFYYFKPMTYAYFTDKLKERLENGETVEILLDNTTSLQPANVDRFEKFLKDEIEITINSIDIRKLGYA